MSARQATWIKVDEVWYIRGYNLAKGEPVVVVARDGTTTEGVAGFIFERRPDGMVIAEIMGPTHLADCW